MEVHTCHLSTQEVEQKGHEFKVTLDYMSGLHETASKF